MYNGSQYNQIQYDGIDQNIPIPIPSYTVTLDIPRFVTEIDIPELETYAGQN